MQDINTAAINRIVPKVATKVKCCVVTITFSAVLPNNVPSIPANCLLDRYARGNAATAIKRVSIVYCKMTAGFSIPTASRIPISFFLLRIDIDKIRIINTMLTTVITTISVVISVPVSEIELETRSYTSSFAVIIKLF